MGLQRFPGGSRGQRAHARIPFDGLLRGARAVLAAAGHKRKPPMKALALSPARQPPAASSAAARCRRPAPRRRAAARPAAAPPRRRRAGATCAGRRAAAPARRHSPRRWLSRYGRWASSIGTSDAVDHQRGAQAGAQAQEQQRAAALSKLPRACIAASLTIFTGQPNAAGVVEADPALAQVVRLGRGLVVCVLRRGSRSTPPRMPSPWPARAPRHHLRGASSSARTPPAAPRSGRWPGS